VMLLFRMSLFYVPVSDRTGWRILNVVWS